MWTPPWLMKSPRTVVYFTLEFIRLTDVCGKISKLFPVRFPKISERPCFILLWFLNIDFNGIGVTYQRHILFYCKNHDNYDLIQGKVWYFFWSKFFILFLEKGVYNYVTEYLKLYWLQTMSVVASEWCRLFCTILTSNEAAIFGLWCGIKTIKYCHDTPFVEFVAGQWGWILSSGVLTL